MKGREARIDYIFTVLTFITSLAFLTQEFRVSSSPCPSFLKLKPSAKPLPEF